MRITFVSNYINHHQIPFSEAMLGLCGSEHEYCFIQTEPMEAERRNMGWGGEIPEFVRLAYVSEEENKACRQLIMDSEVVIFGGCEDESYISPRLEEMRLALKSGKQGANLAADGFKKITVRYSERLYREAQWKWISPRGLIRKYKDHVRYNSFPVYLLCSGGYVASDFGLIHAYKNKMYKWGYFPKCYKYDLEELLAGKGFCDGHEKIPYILWAGRFLKLKHPELAITVAEHLKNKGLRFKLDIIGGGELEDTVKSLVAQKDLADCVRVLPFMKPEEVREYMKKADIYLFTSDRNEGWGAVVNESMNSACAVVVGHMIGASTYLIENGENGFIYNDAAGKPITEIVEKLIENSDLRLRIARNAYETVTKYWNAEYAADNLLKLIHELRGEVPETERGYANKPLQRDYPKSEARINKEKFGFVKPKRV